MTPQIVITFVFFIWPASQALKQSVFIEDPFGLSSEFVGFDNFIELFSDPLYLGSLKTTFFLLVVNVVYSFFETFGIIHAVTQGGPYKATDILVYKVYRDGFIGLDLGGSAAQSVVLMAIVVTLTVIQFRYLERKVQY